MKFFRDWGMSVAVILTWALGFGYALCGLGRASTHKLAPVPAIQAMAP
jgi:hypothetical protein